MLVHVLLKVTHRSPCTLCIYVQSKLTKNKNRYTITKQIQRPEMKKARAILFYIV